MNWYICSERDLNNLQTTCIEHGAGPDIPFGSTQVHMAMANCKSLPIPADLMNAICNEPWEYRDRWLKQVNRIAHKLRLKRLLKWGRQEIQKDHG